MFDVWGAGCKNKAFVDCVYHNMKKTQTFCEEFKCKWNMSWGIQDFPFLTFVLVHFSVVVRVQKRVKKTCQQL